MHTYISYTPFIFGYELLSLSVLHHLLFFAGISILTSSMFSLSPLSPSPLSPSPLSPSFLSHRSSSSSFLGLPQKIYFILLSLPRFLPPRFLPPLHEWHTPGMGVPSSNSDHSRVSEPPQHPLASEKTGWIPCG